MPPKATWDYKNKGDNMELSLRPHMTKGKGVSRNILSFGQTQLVSYENTHRQYISKDCLRLDDSQRCIIDNIWNINSTNTTEKIMVISALIFYFGKIQEKPKGKNFCCYALFTGPKYGLYKTYPELQQAIGATKASFRGYYNVEQAAEEVAATCGPSYYRSPLLVSSPVNEDTSYAQVITTPLNSQDKLRSQVECIFEFLKRAQQGKYSPQLDTCLRVKYDTEYDIRRPCKAPYTTCNQTYACRCQIIYSLRKAYISAEEFPVQNYRDVQVTIEAILQTGLLAEVLFQNEEGIKKLPHYIQDICETALFRKGRRLRLKIESSPPLFKNNTLIEESNCFIALGLSYSDELPELDQVDLEPDWEVLPTNTWASLHKQFELARAHTQSYNYCWTSKVLENFTLMLTGPTYRFFWAKDFGPYIQPFTESKNLKLIEMFASLTTYNDASRDTTPTHSDKDSKDDKDSTQTPTINLAQTD